MNLYFRLVRLILLSLLARRTGLFGSSVIAFRVWPLDCDLNMHMNNGRYLTLMDLGRFYYMAQADMLWKMFRYRWMPVIAAVESAYLRPLPPFRRFELKTRLLGWDEKYFYFEQEFHANGRLCAAMLVKGLMLTRGRPTPSKEVLARVAPGTTSPSIEKLTASWQKLTRTRKNLGKNNQA